MEADLIVDIDEVAEQEATLQEPEIATPESLPPLEESTPPEETEPTTDLPEIEVDAWIDLEDTWEKDYYFSVFTDDELYHHTYALYYHALKDERLAQHLARQQVASLKATLARMKDRREPIPAHLVPVFRGTRMNLADDYGAYKAFHARLAKLPYTEAAPLLQRAYLNTLKALNADEPYLQFHERRELELLGDEGAEPAEESESGQDGGAPKKAKKPKKGKGKAAAEPEPEPEPIANAPGMNRMVYVPTDETPLPIEGVLQYDRLPAEAIPELTVKERVEYPAPTLQDRIGVQTLDWKKPSSLARVLRKDTAFPFETYVLEKLPELLSMHALQVHLATYGFFYDRLTRAEREHLAERLETLRRREKQGRVGRTRYTWDATPVAGWKPSEQSPFLTLKPWAEAAMAAFEKTRAAYQTKLGLLEKHSDTFTKHPGMRADIYDLALAVQHNQIDIEEAIATLQSIYQDLKHQTYVDFLRDLLSAEWNPADIDAATAAWNRMDASVEVSKASLLHHYEPDHTFQVGAAGAPAYALEDTFGREDIPEPADEAEEDDDREAEPFEAEAETMEVFEPPAVQSVEGETSASGEGEGTETDAGTAGQREVWRVVRRMLRELHQTTDLPLPEETLTAFVYQHYTPLLQRLSLLEQLSQAFPEIPVADLKTLVEQKVFLGVAEDEAGLRKAYKDAYTDMKKAIVEAFLYALTHWVIYLQDQTLRQGIRFAPTYTPCLGVWAFYGTPMSSSDDKGIARYLVCVSLALLENDPDHSAWSVLRGLPEKKLLDRIYKNAQLPEYTEVVAFLKEQWKDRWKEIARKEKDMEVRLETLERATDNPKEYLKLYTTLMLHLPLLLAKSGAQKKESMVVPVANSCCFQPLSQRFQPFADFKEAGLFTHRAAMARTTATGRPGRTGELGRVQLFDPLLPGVSAATFYKDTQCREAYTTPEVGTATPAATVRGISQRQWNALCSLLDEPDWKLGLPTAAEALVGETSTTHIRRATQALAARLTASKSLLERWDTWVQHRGTWEEKKRLLVFLRTTMKDERVLHDWAASSLTTAMAVLEQWSQTVADWVPGDFPEAPMELMNYLLHRALILPDTDAIHPKQLQTLRSNRFDRVLIRLMKKEIPTQRAIQDYYANVREKLKVGNLEAYKSKTIQEIQELQDAKRLKLSSLLAKPGTAGETATEAYPGAADDAVEAEGLAEHRVYATWNADEMNPDALDP